MIQRSKSFLFFALPFVVLCLGLTVTARAEDEKKEANKAEPVDFGGPIESIMKRRCTECHGISKKSGGLRLDTYDFVIKGSRKGPVVLPGKAAESKVVLRVLAEGKKKMPPPDEGDPLTEEEVVLLKRWIDEGAHPPAATTKKREIVFRPLPAAFAPVFAVAGDTEGRFLAVGRSSTIRVTQLGDGEKDAAPIDLKGHRDVIQALAFSPDGRILASAGFQIVILWDTESWKEIRRLEGHVDRVLALDFSTDGALLAAAGGRPSSTGEVKIWEVSTGKLVKDLPEVHSDTIFSIDFSPDHKQVATGAADRVVGVIDLESGKRVIGFDGHTHHVIAVRYTTDGKKLISGGADNKIKSWDLEKKSKINDWNGHTKAVMGLAVSPDGTFVASVSGDKTLRLWNPADGKQKQSFSESKEYLYTVSIFAKGQRVAAAGRDKVVRVYDTKENKLLRSIEP